MPSTKLPVGSLTGGSRITCPADFGAQLSFEGPWAVVGVRGDLDIATVPTLRTLLDGLVESGHHLIVLDLGSVTFMGAAGLGAVTGTLNRLNPLQGVLMLRSVPTKVDRLLDMSGLSASMTVEVAGRDLALGSANDRSDASALSDADLVAGIGSRQFDAMAEVYERHSGHIHTLAAQIWGTSRADQIVQDVFAQLWQVPESFDQDHGSLGVHLSMQVRLWLAPGTDQELVERRGQANAQDRVRSELDLLHSRITEHAPFDRGNSH